MFNSFLPQIDKIPNLLLTIILAVFVFILFLVFIKFAKYVKNSITRMRRSSREKKDKKRKFDIMYHQLGQMLYYLILFIGGCFIIPFLGIQQSSLIAILGTIGLGLCLSSQSVIANIWCGFCIVLNDIFNIGDVISVRNTFQVQGEVPVGLVRGTVVDFNLFYTKLIDEKGIEISIPNNIIYGINCVVLNESINK